MEKPVAGIYANLPEEELSPSQLAKEDNRHMSSGFLSVADRTHRENTGF